MKKILAAGALAIVIGAGSFMAYADSPISIPNNRNEKFTIEEREEWRNERHSIRKDELKKALENKEITEAEAKEWEEHFDYMDEFHNKQRDNNSFMGNGRHMNGGRGCGGSGYGMGRGMMRGNGVRNN